MCEQNKKSEYRIEVSVSSIGLREVSVFAKKPVRMRCITLTSLDCEDADEREKDLPEPVTDFFNSIPRVLLYAEDDGSNIRARLFHAITLELWDGPIASVAECRKHLMAYVSDTPTDKDLSFVQSCVTHLYNDQSKLGLCGCGAELKEGIKEKRCESCGAIMCSDCMTANNCDGCFRILQESANDIGADDDDCEFGF